MNRTITKNFQLRKKEKKKIQIGISRDVHVILFVKEECDENFEIFPRSRIVQLLKILFEWRKEKKKIQIRISR